MRQAVKDDWLNVAKLVPKWETYKNELESVVDLKRLHRVGPVKYQHYLYALVRHFRPKVIVETGVRKGPSTVLTYAAMLDNAHLYSCDPCHRSQQEATAAILEATGVTIAKAAWTFFPEKSETALFKIPTPWDFFIHDSDHGAENMAFEMTYAWSQLRPGGVIVVDDWSSCVGAPRKHEIFIAIVAGVGQTAIEIGSAAVFRKPE